MKSAEDVFKAIADNGIEWVRVVFVDQHGVTRGKTLAASALKSAFDKGAAMTSTLLLKDTSHTTVFPVWETDAGFGAGVMTGASDFLMKPDPGSFKILPWLDNTAWLLSDICLPDGRAIELSTRRILRKAIAGLADKGLEFICGLEVEFYVLKIDDVKLQHENSNRPHDPPQTSLLAHGYQYLTENRVDELGQVMELIQTNTTALKLPLRTIESEFGPSQFEVTFDPMTALKAADMMVLFRNMVKQVCRRHGFHATFMCRPGFKNSMGSGWHLHQSLVNIKTGENRFVPVQGRDLTPLASQWIGGILTRANESCILTTPTVNGYKRYQPFALAPDRVQWGHDNRGAMLRALLNAGDNASRLENRVGEPAANPYLYIASQILSGLGGIEKKMSAPQPVERPYEEDAQKLPGNLADAMAAFSNSAFFREQLGDEFVDYFTHLKRAEWQRYLGTVSEWEQREYFSLF